MQRVRVELTPLPPYNFELALAYLQTSPSTVLEKIERQKTYYRAMNIDGNDVLLSIWSVGTVEVPYLVVEICGNCITTSITKRATQHIRTIFSLDKDPEPFYDTCSHDPVFEKLLLRYYGLRPVLIADPYEALLWAIIAQQVNTVFARKLKKTLVDLCGRRLCIDGTEYSVLPDIDAVTILDEHILRYHQFSAHKISHLIQVSQAVEDGRINFEALRKMTHENAINTLIQFRGIGRWTAEYVLMHGLGGQDSIPAADMRLRTFIGRTYGLGRAASEIEVRHFAESWTNWRGWAAFYWWLAIQLEKEICVNS